ncbi:hypothetical protein IscW_ISCW021488 [Ixodes scapularis]|uniref:Uncharacterized protein n=1 Tax=Ixodes scapularis TaxID=6945 RepID=B7Q722_IXOSC|nr:hypothetical protein IscW_ISCW021488 [Ixodes scapularis]|eukprot:XP_002412078.1 hypothetical protein IscW_ISCW021488 [Ixodes scapularis]
MANGDVFVLVTVRTCMHKSFRREELAEGIDALITPDVYDELLRAKTEFEAEAGDLGPDLPEVLGGEPVDFEENEIQAEVQFVASPADAGDAGTEPRRTYPYKIPMMLRAEVDRQIDQLLDWGLIYPVEMFDGAALAWAGQGDAVEPPEFSCEVVGLGSDPPVSDALVLAVFLMLTPKTWFKRSGEARRP